MSISASRSRWATWLALLCAPLILASCADDGSPSTTPGDSGVDAGGDEPDGETALPLSCDPTPERCDGLGAERPPRLSEHAAAYDSDRLEMVVYGGSTAVPQQCDFPSPAFTDVTWIYDDPCSAWTRLALPGPGPRVRHMMTWGGGNTWLFGGRYRDPGADPLSTPYTLYDDLWRLDGQGRQWSAVPTTGGRPTARVNGALVWDDRRSSLWLFGGNTSTSGLAYQSNNDVWQFDMAAGAWTRQTPSGGPPPPRLFPAALYDPVRDSLVVFGGADETAFDNDARYMNDLWALDLDGLTWTLLHSGTGGPDRRFWARMAYDAESDAYILFGGHDEAQGGGELGNRNDTWAFDPETAEWSRLAPEDVFNNAGDGDFCELPADFTMVAAGVPERRDAHTFVWSATCGHGLIFAGKTDCGASDDVWSWSDGTWTERLEATDGEVCQRWRSNPDNCVNLCF